MRWVVVEGAKIDVCNFNVVAVGVRMLDLCQKRKEVHKGGDGGVSATGKNRVMGADTELLSIVES
jgi:hypothetical protein